MQLAVEGDLLFPVPSWVSYIPQTLITRDEVIKIQPSLETGFRINAAQLEIAYPDPQGAFYLYPDFEPYRSRLAAFFSGLHD